MKLHHRESPAELARVLLLDQAVDPGVSAQARVAECVRKNDPDGALIWLEVWAIVTGQRPTNGSPAD